MKKLLFIIAVVTCTIGNVSGQSPIISEFRQIVGERATQFKSLQKDLLQDNTEKGVKIYAASLGESSICKSLITQSQVDGTVYLLIYNISTMDAMKLKIFTNVAQQYITELNDMVKTGKYSGRDYNDNGESITEITDSDGKLVAQYVSGANDHMIIVYGV